MSGRPFARLDGLGAYAPSHVVTNADFERTLDTSDQWIVERTGIRERRWAAPGETLASMCRQAAECAMGRAGATAGELDAIILGTASPDRLLPSVACDLQALLGAERAAAFDVQAACSGFIYGLTIAEGLLATGTYRTILVVGAEKLSAIADMQDRSTAILFGDGAGAAVVRATNGAGGAGGDGRGILSTFIKSDGRLAEYLYRPAGGTARPIDETVLRERSQYIKMAGREVFKAAVLAMAEACDEALRRAGVSADELDLLVPHQANIRIIEATAKHAGMPMSKVMVNVERYGNTSAASIPLALAQAEEEGRIRKGSLVLLVGFGAGFTWGSTVIRW
ncbi:MAG TPA: beta-ketoacyl-ACP synthase III [Gemmatimonadales bacterium]|nr:beta-ketoacyl-ACP synthase III [Gemmatimonadales bacterium]